jgi:diguanylate cyclase (GGDEF)-like protein
MNTRQSTSTLDEGLSLDDARRPLLLRRQIESYYSTVPAAVVGNLFNAVLIVLFTWTSIPHVLGLEWLAAVAGLSAWRVADMRAYRKAAGGVDPERALRAIEIFAFVVGAVRAVAVAWLGAALSPSQLFVVPIVGAGMMSAGASTLHSIPRAALVFCGASAFGAAASFATLEPSVSATALALLASYCILLYRSVTSNFKHFVARALHECDVVEQADTVKLLLRDYEEQGSDWLRTVDAGGRLGAASERFAEAAQRPRETLENLAFVNLFDATPEREILREHLDHMRAFDDLTMPLTIDNEVRWWTLSARPRLGADRVTITGLRGVATDVTEARRAETKVAYMAHYDGLTDLPNRFRFNESLNRALNRRKNGHYVAALCLDLDQFKSVNDTLGRPVGDKLLQAVARRLDSCLDGLGMVARLGGDEFAVLLSDVENIDAVFRLATTVIRNVSEAVDIDGQHVLTATSIGVAIAPQDGETVSDLLKNADLALYDAKANGRNRFSFFKAGMDEAARNRRQLEMDLRTALRKNELSLHYQPLINIETGKISGCEALMRWRHPERGVVMPSDFVPLAEETGLIVQLGEWVIREAVAEVARWPEHMHVAVNLSPAQMRSASLISTVINALASSGVSARRLELEITESVLMQNTDANLATLHKLRELGVRISLDDFGTGYSSLNYLRSFPFDKIKIDRCFVEDVDTDDDCRAIISSVTGLAKKLGMITTAEGVERPEQLAELALEGCTEAQGFLFSRAVPAHELTDLRSRPAARPARDVVALPEATLEDIKEFRRRA